MEIQTFRAKSMPQALDLVRQELGPEATVLHTREMHGGLLGRLLWGRSYEIAASADPPPSKVADPPRRGGARGGIKTQTNEGITDPVVELKSYIEELSARGRGSPQRVTSPVLDDLLAEMLQADVDEPVARALLDRLHGEPSATLRDPQAARVRLIELIDADLGGAIVAGASHSQPVTAI